MAYLIEFASTADRSVYAEVSEGDLGVVPAGIDPGQVARRASVAFDEVWVQVCRLADSASAAVDKIAKRPDEAEVTFLFKLSAELGAVLARTSADASFTVKLKWTSKPETTTSIEP